MTAIQRAARAMYDEVQPEWDWNDPDAELMQAMYRANARAALAALRTPDPEMLKAAGSEEAARIWTAMIDAALGEG